MSISGLGAYSSVLANREPARPGPAGRDAGGGTLGSYISHPNRHRRPLVQRPVLRAACRARWFSAMAPARQTHTADANGEFGPDADGRRRATRRYSNPPAAGPFGTSNKRRHRPGLRDRGVRAQPAPQLPLHRPVLRHGQAPLVRTTRGGSKARGLLSGRCEKFLSMD